MNQIVISTAIDNTVSDTLDGANFFCLTVGANAKQFTLTDAPGSVSNVSVNLINNSSMLISWAYQNDNEKHCLTNGTLYEVMNAPFIAYTILV